MFVCSKCGICCKNIDKVPELSNFHNGDGICIHLTSNNLCDIYENRPAVCNVEKMFQQKYKEVMTLEEYEKRNLEGCRILQQM